MQGTPRPDSVSTRLLRIAKLAREAPDMVFTSLAHHIDIYLLREAFWRTRKSGAPGVDGQTAAQFEKDLEKNLQSLLDRFKSGSYRAPPVKRAHIPKGDGSSTRPIGIPTFEDKVLQRAVAMVLEAVYEQDFMDCSYGFRPKRSPHDALREMREKLKQVDGGWVVEADIKGFFDNLGHQHLRQFLDQRVRDGVLRRMIDKWLKAGVMEDGAVTHPDAGTPQGGVVSPLLANIYLHEVLDKWFVEAVDPTLYGRAFLIRYADDFVIVCTSEQDAHGIRVLLDERFAAFGLTLHPDKTKVLRFRRPKVGSKGKGDRNGSPPQTFDFLGFTVHWGRTRRGGWAVLYKTAKSRFSRALRAIHVWCRRNRHLPIREQQQALSRKILGHLNYYGVSRNGRAIENFIHEVRRTWRYWLHRRSQRARMWWGKFNKLVERYPLPRAHLPRSSYRPAANP